MLDKSGFTEIKIGERTIIIGGVGRMFYQEGFPLSMAISMLASDGKEVSLYHVADEMIKSGGFPINKNGCAAFRAIKAALSETIHGDAKPSITLEQLEKFCLASYEDQREMIFQYLYGYSTDDVRTGKNSSPVEWLKENWIPNENDPHLKPV